MKQILVTPRYHFKKIEDSNYETLLNELNELKQRMAALGIKPEDLQVHRANLAILNINNGTELYEVKSALKEADKRDISLNQSEVFSLAKKIALKDDQPKIDPLRTTTLAWSRIGNFTPGSPISQELKNFTPLTNRIASRKDQQKNSNRTSGTIESREDIKNRYKPARITGNTY